MHTPEVYIAYTPRGVGLLGAVFYLAEENDIYGWWSGARDNEFPTAFFLLENFYSPAKTAFYATRGTDVYGGWVSDYSDGREVALGMPLPVTEVMCHALEEIQSEFAREWLFYPDDPAAQGDVAAYQHAKLPVQGVNVKSKKLHKLNKDDVVWTYNSHGLDLNVIDYIRQRWPLDLSTTI